MLAKSWGKEVWVLAGRLIDHGTCYWVRELAIAVLCCTANVYLVLL